MVFLLDESNIHKAVGLSSIALIGLKNLDHLHELDSHVEKIERQLRIRPFHWAGSNWDVRDLFVSHLNKAAFSIRAAIMKNPTNIEAAIESALPELISEPQVHRLILDGDKPKEYAGRLKRTLRDSGVHVVKLRTESDLARPALRIADCLAGLIRHHSEHPAGKSQSSYAAIRTRIEIIIRT